MSSINGYIFYIIIAGGSGIFRKNPRKNEPEDHGSEYRAKVGVATCHFIYNIYTVLVDWQVDWMIFLIAESKRRYEEAWEA